jgi:hypothetical protein
MEFEPFYTVFFYRPLKTFYVRSHHSRETHMTFDLSTCFSACPTERIFVGLCIEDFTNICREAPRLVKSFKNIGHFTWRPQYVFIVKSSTKFVVARRQCKVKPLVYFHGNAEHFVLLTAACTPTTIKWKHSNNGYANAPRCYVVGTLCIL